MMERCKNFYKHSFSLLLGSVLLLLVPLSSVAIGNKELITEGGSNGWRTNLVNVQAVDGQDGSLDYVLADNSEFSMNNVDLHLRFDSERLNKRSKSIDMSQIEWSEKPYRYKVLSHKFILSAEEAKFGNAAAKFFQIDDRLELMPEKQSWFHETEYSESFTIEFWVKPIRTAMDQILFSKYGPILPSDRLEKSLPTRLKYSGIRCILSKQKITWHLQNFFHPPIQASDVPNLEDEQGLDPAISSPSQQSEFSLNTKTSILPQRWYHVALTYDQKMGQLSLFVNGEVEDWVWTTKDQKPRGLRLIPHFVKGENSSLVIGQNFYGFLDEIMITKEKKTQFNLSNFSQDSGIITSVVYDLGSKGCKLLGFQMNYQQPQDSLITFEYRIRKDYFTGDMSSSVLPWIQIDTNHPNRLPYRQGRYVQWRASMKVGMKSDVSPRLNDLHIEYMNYPVPEIPSGVTAESRNGKVIVRWFPNVDENLGGYKIYIGTKPGNYLSQGNPIILYSKNISNLQYPIYLIENLNANTIYYISMTAFDTEDQESNFSKEISVRVSPMP